MPEIENVENITMAKFEAPIIKEWDLTVWSFKRISRFVWKNVDGEQGVALQQHFPYKSSKFSENLNCRINLLFYATGLKLGHLGIFDALFLFWHCSSYSL